MSSLNDALKKWIGVLENIYSKTGDENFNPKNNELLEVYGPPEMIEEYARRLEADYQAEDNENVIMYGPPFYEACAKEKNTDDRDDTAE